MQLFRLAQRIVRLAQRFVSSRLGKVCGWICFCQMILLAIASLTNLVLRRFSGDPIDMADALLLLFAFFGFNVSRVIYVTFSLSVRPRTAKQS